MKFFATIQKDVRILLRDKTGLLLMFAMPVLLVIVVTAIQNSTFDVLNKNQIALLVCNKDSGKLSKDFLKALDTSGMFTISITNNANQTQLANEMRAKNIVLGVVIDPAFSQQLETKAKITAGKALHSFGLEGDTSAINSINQKYLSLYYNPVIQPSLKISIQSALNAALQTIESKEVLRNLYFSINEKPLPDSLENEMLNNDLNIEEIPLTANHQQVVLNASQHNVPAWTIFAMFFVVMSLGSSIVREKLSGSFIRLRTLPTNYFIALLSKQITYLAVTFLQAVLIFTIGIFLFPLIGLPALHLPADIFGLIIITSTCGLCAVSYAMCVGVFAQTQEQANAFGAVSIVILSIIGGLMVPDFIMPQTFKTLMSISPLHWCLQAYYGLFLQGGKLKDVAPNILSLIIITIILQLVALLQLKRKRFI